MPCPPWKNNKNDDEPMDRSTNQSRGQFPSQPYDRGEIMDPISVTASAVTLVGAVASTASALKTLRSDYHGASSDSLHIQEQKKHLQLNQSLLNGFNNHASSPLNGVRSSLAEIETVLPSQPCETKRSKVRWAAGGGKRKARDAIGKLKETETSLNSTLLFTANEKLRELHDIKDMLNEICSVEDRKISSHDRRLEILEENMLEQLGSLRVLNERLHESITQKFFAEVSCCNWLLCLGIVLRWITAEDNYHTFRYIMLRWPLFYSMILVCRVGMVGGWPTKFYISLRPRTEVASNSAIIEACRANDIETIQNLLSHREAHVNDVTTENLTPLRFAIRAGHVEVVKLLLESGANPNQTFGKNETSPLNNAFFEGNQQIIRLLLSAKADLDHMNTRTWTCLYYLWDPQRSNHPDTTVILEICANYQFDGWKLRDRSGWAVIHRAAAFGEPQHIQKFLSMGVVDQYAKTVAGWSAIQVATRYGNLSTLDYLVTEARLSSTTLGRMRDKRGWTLLHLAAASGSKETIMYLLSKGVSSTDLSSPSTLLLPVELDYKSLTPRDVAEHYGYAQVYDKALKSMLLVEFDPITSEETVEKPG